MTFKEEIDDILERNQDLKKWRIDTSKSAWDQIVKKLQDLAAHGYTQYEYETHHENDDNQDNVNDLISTYCIREDIEIRNYTKDQDGFFSWLNADTNTNVAVMSWYQIQNDHQTDDNTLGDKLYRMAREWNHKNFPMGDFNDKMLTHVKNMIKHNAEQQAGLTLVRKDDFDHYVTNKQMENLAQYFEKQGFKINIKNRYNGNLAFVVRF
ncbi:hypothetical protein WR164_03740 [Philodulcilactobacillus myokoensis]|uniref:Uncharacterized protein n=1 Tax=Philodulcilactobacillus myokoensis TaxID=2929573 RepID=A0A9W6B0Q4_9LACO|nr:hypothetical protein [Philodulcilactobacillus myokoensis]GLB46395.1 hypothetical protein WR164_03740 [Philodulcilactobacillus myokoensis]